MGESEEILTGAKHSGFRSQETAAIKIKVFYGSTPAIQRQVLPPLNPTCQGKEAAREGGRERRAACTQRRAVRAAQKAAEKRQ